MDWKRKITELIESYVHFYEADSGTRMRWKAPLVGFANAHDPEFLRLRQLVHPEHALPQDILPDASIVVSYFLPYPESVALTNDTFTSSEIDGSETALTVSAGDGTCLAVPAASSQWAYAYRETNKLFAAMNDYLVSALCQLTQTGVSRSSSVTDSICSSNASPEALCTLPVHAAIPGAAASMDNVAIVSRWSQRHVARIAGLGTFGLNNMLITENGCCGRFSSFITSLQTQADSPQSSELCLYRYQLQLAEQKKTGFSRTDTAGAAPAAPSAACGLCTHRCPSGALTEAGFDRQLCLKVCQANQRLHDPNHSFGTDSEVCGKCLISLPCSFQAPNRSNLSL